MSIQEEVIRQQVLSAYDAAQYETVLGLGEHIIKRRRSDGLLHLAMGSSARALGRFDQAEHYLRTASGLMPRDPLVQVELGRLKFSLGRFDESLAALERALRVKPAYAAALAIKAGVLEHRGDYDAARATLEPLVQAGLEDETMAVVYVRVLLEAREFERALEISGRHVVNPKTGALNRAHLHEAAAKAHERLGQYDRAFASYQAAAETQRLNFDAEAHVRDIDELIATFNRTNLSRLPRAANTSNLPVIIACMPRSGSTLVEQIIHAHPQAFGAGEITQLSTLVCDLPQKLDSYRTYPTCVFDLLQSDVDALASECLRELGRLGGKAKRVTNKALDNYLHLGIAQLVFPGARIVHVRREAMDNCFSCFTAPLMLPWSTDLRHIALAYRQCERLMAHWKEVIDLPLLDVPYEALVAEPEPWIRRIIDFCGLPWDDRCLRYWEANRSVMTLSYDQVRKPIYRTSVERWRHYEPFLGCLREALQSRT